MINFEVLVPDAQISFSAKLETIRSMYLGEAMRQTVQTVGVAKIDRELAKYVEADYRTKVGTFGLRGEVFFPVPCLLAANPFLLGYYRLLYGFSQKQFYSQGPFGKFATLEEKGHIPTRIEKEIPDFCRSLVGTAEMLVDGVTGTAANLTLEVVKELQLLTLGPQFRGGRNNAIGDVATQTVFDLIKVIVKPYVKQEIGRTLIIENAIGHTVSIAFSNDPDIAITSKIATGLHPILAIEIKGGKDVSNLLNRLGEAEKSHVSAKASGYPQCWTITNVEIEESKARGKSPSTNKFFYLGDLLDKKTGAYKTFEAELCSDLGIKAVPAGNKTMKPHKKTAKKAK